jgi:phosphatidylserine/phosphatidylglycerophosphate/cardiolipin synthase-like enzyme
MLNKSLVATVLLAGVSGFPFLAALVTPLIEKPAMFARALQIVQTAHNTIRLEAYSLNGDDAMVLAQQLVAKARQGVVVQVLLDKQSQKQGLLAEETFNPQGINNAIPDYLRQQAEILSNTGGPPRLQVLDFNDEATPNQPIDEHGFPAQGLPLHHAKGLFVDGRWVIVGSANFDRDPTHDVSLLIDDVGLANCFVERFNLQWSLAGGYVMPGEACTRDPRLELFTVGGGLQEAKPQILAMLHDPKTRSLALEMYALADLDILDGLKTVHQRGGKVRVIVNKGNADPDPDNFYLARALRDAGIEVRRFQEIPGGYMHTKFAIVNRESVMVGSLNWVHNEFNYIWNYMLYLHLPDLAQTMLSIFETDWTERSLPYFEASGDLWGYPRKAGHPTLSTTSRHALIALPRSRQVFDLR